jgi:hypothetical protein
MERKRPARGRAGQGCIRRASYGPAGRGAQGLDAADLEALARSLGGAKRVGDGWSCRCPLHDDRHASLSLGLGEGGRLLARCHAGCDQREVFRAVVDRSRELGLLAAPARTGRPKAVKAAVPAPRPKAAYAASAGARATKQRHTWPAHDAATGGHVADHVREDTASGKRVWWSKRDVKVADLALYRAARLAEQPDRPAVVCEGEVATDALAALEDRLGIVALGTQTGAAGTPGDAALEPLRGRTVFLWPDNDDPGHAHMERIARRLTELDVEDAPPKGDAAERGRRAPTSPRCSKLRDAGSRRTSNPPARRSRATTTTRGR